MHQIPRNLFYFTFLAILISCSHGKKKPEVQGPLVYDTARIAIFQHDTANHRFPGNSSPAILTQEDIYTIDSLLTHCIGVFNDEQVSRLKSLYQLGTPPSGGPQNFIIDLKEYKRQYIPYVDEYGGKVVVVNCFCREHDSWRNIFVSASDGGKCYFHLTCNLTAKKYRDFSVNGPG